MLDTFIKNKGISKTIIHNNNKNYYNEIDWDADYDGEVAKISLNINDNGINEHFNAQINNDEMAELFNIPSKGTAIDKRLYNDFLGKRPKKFDEHNMILIYKQPKPKPIKKVVKFIEPNEIVDSLENIMIPQEDKYTHISSPFPEENLLFPLQIKTHKTRHKTRHGTRNSTRHNRHHKKYKISRKKYSTSTLNKTSSHRKTNKYSRRHTF
jgi:hypothetical protein